MTGKTSRRDFIRVGSAVTLTGLALPPTSGAGYHSSTLPRASRSALQRRGVGVIGMRYQGSVIAHRAAEYADIVAVCDVDRHVRDQAKASFGSTPFACEDYRDLLHKPKSMWF